MESQGPQQGVVVYFDASLFLNGEIAIHAQVLAGFVVGAIKGRVGIPSEPDTELLVEPPGILHEFFGGEILLGLALVEVEHEEL